MKSWGTFKNEMEAKRSQTGDGVGKKNEEDNILDNNHRNHIQKGVSSCELSEHFLYNTRTHNFDNHVITTILKQIKRDEMAMGKNIFSIS